MKAYEVVITGASELFFGRPVLSPKERNETHEQHDARTSKEKVWIRSEEHTSELQSH